MEALDASIEEETWSRLDNAFKKKKIVKIEGGSVRGNQNLNLQEELLKLEMPISMQMLDSVYNVKLQKLNLQTEVFLKHVSTKPYSLIQANAPLKKMSWGALKTEIIPIRLDGSEGIQAVLLNPYEMIFTRLGLILIATVLIMLFVAGCIAYQIRIILFQNKLAKLKDDFSHAMVHDMKTPITTIMMGLHTLHSGKLDTKPEKKEKNFTIVKEEAQHLLTLVNEILTISKLESDKLELSKQAIPIAEVINDLVEKAQAHANKPIRFELDIQQETIIADPVYIKEVIANLIDNAIKYSKETGIELCASGCRSTWRPGLGGKYRRRI